jgi:hypothetical protein
VQLVEPIGRSNDVTGFVVDPLQPLLAPEESTLGLTTPVACAVATEIVQVNESPTEIDIAWWCADLEGMLRHPMDLLDMRHHLGHEGKTIALTSLIERAEQLRGGPYSDERSWVDP